MQELSLNILDIAQNSIVANASVVDIEILINSKQKNLVVSIIDNGKGMSEETVKNVVDPFYTTRTTRKVGLGIPFFKMMAEATGGELSLESTLGAGTKISANFTLGHIDLIPLGDMASTICSLIQCNPDINFIYTVSENDETFTLNTKDLRVILGEVSFATAEVALFIREYIEENSNHIIQRSILTI